MSQVKNISPLELGCNLSRLRESAGLRQSELAKKITWSQPVLSKIESGERAITIEELEEILHQIATPEAQKFRNAIDREWLILARPELDHPEQDSLWEAELVLQQLHSLKEYPDIKYAFSQRLDEYIDELKSAANLLLQRKHQIAFVGKIGVGKSTAICGLAELEIVVPNSTQPKSVFATGAGGTTICEVHLRGGPGYGLLIEPASNEEIRNHIEDFAQAIWMSIGNQEKNNDDEQMLGVSKEIERSIRNMSSLKIRKDNKESKRRIDDAKELAKKYDSYDKFSAEIFFRMSLSSRSRHDIWYEPMTGKNEKEWLKEVFVKVNDGTHPEFTLPKRIEVIIPDGILEQQFDLKDLSIRIIDTKGIDQTVAREDLATLQDQSHTLLVLCTSFNDAPSVDIQNLLERAKKSGISNFSEKSALFVLPRPNEALGVRDDDSGDQVDSKNDGYEIKKEQIDSALERLGFRDIPVHMFNYSEDDRNNVRMLLGSQILKMRNCFSQKLEKITSNARHVFENYQDQQRQEVLRKASNFLKIWINENSNDLSNREKPHIEKSLIEEINKLSSSTVKASIRREGIWRNLNYYSHIGFGIRYIAVEFLREKISDFRSQCNTLRKLDEYAGALNLIDQTLRILDDGYDLLIRKLEENGNVIFRKELGGAKDFWDECQREHGSGYRDRIAQRTQTWFESSVSRDLEKQLLTNLETEWRRLLERIENLLE